MRDIIKLSKKSKITRASSVNNSMHHEPQNTLDATKCVGKILAANCAKAALQSVVQVTCLHLSIPDQTRLLEVLQDYEDLSNGTLSDWKTKPVSYELKDDAKPYHGRAFPVPKIHRETLVKELNKLCELEVLMFQPASEWAAPSFIISKKDHTIQFISDFRGV